MSKKNRLIRKVKSLEKKEIRIENKKDKLFNKIDQVEKESIKKELRMYDSNICPFCEGKIKLTGDRSAKCKSCEFAVFVSTVSDKQDEYIFYHSWFKKPLVVVDKLNKLESYTCRYLKPSKLKQVLKDERLVKIGKIWKNGIIIEKKMDVNAID